MNRTPEQIVEAFIQTATTQEQRLIVEMIETYKKRAEHWEAKAKDLEQRLEAASTVTWTYTTTPKINPFEPSDEPSDG